MTTRVLLFVTTFATFAVVTALCGCRSAVSTHVAADPVNGGWKTTRLRGVPVTVKVPTHLEVRVIERRYLTPDTCTTFHVARYVEHEIREKDQVFTVDSVRAGAGTLKYKSNFDNKVNPQFFSSFDTNVDDTTIKAVTALVPKLPEVLGNLRKAGAVSKAVGVSDVPGDYPTVDSLVAVKLFDVNAPDLSECVQAFLDQHVNACAPACPVACPVK